MVSIESSRISKSDGCFSFWICRLTPGGVFAILRHHKGKCPHGIPLLDLAKAEGPEAAPVVEFLQGSKCS